ncbi:MAG TPA: two-component regulator propeller domain-containing protein [Candidatus Kapabacteria bacterium]|nr:two-component regulator propeller domain-containing protein [Candidatus Kapabacteria bacterium]
MPVPLAAVMLLAIAAGLRAQEYDFHNLSVGDGLAQSQVFAICQDRRGSMWFATRGGGVSCYDGASFVTYETEDGLANNYVRAIVEDDAGTLWFGTDDGLCRYDGRRWATVKLPGSASHSLVNALASAPGGVLWIGTEEGVLRYDGHAFSAFTRRDGLPGESIRALALDSRSRLWVGTDRGAAVQDGGHFTALGRAQGVPACPIASIASDRRGAVWLATFGCGLCRVDDHGAQLFTVREGLTSNTVSAVLVARNGSVWIGTSGGGALCYNGAGFRAFSETEGLASNMIVSLAEDSEGNIWLGSSGGGVSRYGGGAIVRFTQRQGYLGNWVYAIDQDRSGAVWFGHSAGGAVRYDGTYYTRYGQADGFTSAKVKCIHHDASGAIWFGTVGDGLYAFADGHFTSMASRGLRSRFINAIDEDSRGRLWLATADAGVICYSPGAPDPAAASRSVGRLHGLPITRINDIAVFGDTIWAATEGGGVARITLDARDSVAVRTFGAADGITSTSVRSVARDRAGTLLFGTAGGGISIYSGGRFRGVTKASDRIPSNNIYAIVVDSAGAVWIGTEKGIARIGFDASYHVRGLRQFGRPEGVVGIEIAQNAAMTDRAGRVWFGTIAGAVRYDPGADHANTNPPRTHIREARLFSRPIASTPFADSVAAWYHLPVGLELPYDQNSISFDFVGISLHNPERVQYQWKLEGLESEWSPRTSQTTAVYSHLPSGTYTFRVRSFNEDGLADSVGASFHFVVRPPFWRAWWFIAACGIAIAVGLWAAVQSWAQRVRREAERERREAEHRRQEIELRGKIVELRQQALRLTMNPHFIFNALNSIQGIVTGGDVAEAKRTIARFGRLMRALIENARTEEVTIEKECEMLRNYIELEKIASQASFEYEIAIAPDIDPAATAIPSMLVQPLVENAIVHGLRDLDRPGRVSVSFQRANGLIRCLVCDNGVGRERAAWSGAVRHPDHTASALAVIEERLEIIAQQRGVAAGISIADLTDASGAASGTCVTLCMPEA